LKIKFYNKTKLLNNKLVNMAHLLVKFSESFKIGTPEQFSFNNLFHTDILCSALSLSKHDFIPSKIIKRCKFIFDMTNQDNYTARGELLTIIHTFEDEKLCKLYFEKLKELDKKFIENFHNQYNEHPFVKKIIKFKRNAIKKWNKKYYSLGPYKNYEGSKSLDYEIRGKYMRNKGNGKFIDDYKFDRLFKNFRTLLNKAIKKFEIETQKYLYIQKFEEIYSCSGHLYAKFEILRVTHIIKELKKELWKVVDIEGVLDSATPRQIYKILYIFKRNSPSIVFLSIHLEYFTLFLLRKYMNGGIIKMINNKVLSFLLELE